MYIFVIKIEFEAYHLYYMQNSKNIKKYNEKIKHIKSAINACISF